MALRSTTLDPTFCLSIGSVGVRWSCIGSGRMRSCSAPRDAATVSRGGDRVELNKSWARRASRQTWDSSILILSDIK